MTISIILIDKDVVERSRLRRLLDAFPEITVIEEADSLEEAIPKIDLLEPELIFLDINIPGMNNFDYMCKFEREPKVIFTTSSRRFSADILQHNGNTLDLLAKPIDAVRLRKSLDKLKVFLLGELSIQRGVLKQEHLHANELTSLLKYDNVFFIKDSNQYRLARLADVYLFESVGNYTKVCFERHSPMILKSLNALEERLDKNYFFRVNRKNIVNLSCVTKILPYFHGRLVLTLKNGQEFIMSRAQARVFKEHLSL